MVKPLFFKGGDIGRLAVCGTVNDLAMVGREPLYLSASFVIEEGLSLADLRAVVPSMRQAAAEAGVQIVTGDTKVVERGAADGLFVNTAGLGLVPAGVDIGGDRARRRRRNHPLAGASATTASPCSPSGRGWSSRRRWPATSLP